MPLNNLGNYKHLCLKSHLVPAILCFKALRVGHYKGISIWELGYIFPLFLKSSGNFSVFMQLVKVLVISSSDEEVS